MAVVNRHRKGAGFPGTMSKNILEEGDGDEDPMVSSRLIQHSLR